MMRPFRPLFSVAPLLLLACSSSGDKKTQPEVQQTEQQWTRAVEGT